MAIKIPPAEIHSRVTLKTFDDQEYLRRSVELGVGLNSLMADQGLSMGQFRRILDFGVGCGRILVNYEHLFEEIEFYGTDIDSVTVNWCRANIAGPRFSVNEAWPPLEYPTAFFNFIYSISVFTHLPEDMMMAWLAEIARVLAPGGVFLATTHGDYCAQLFLPDPNDVEEFRRTGQHYQMNIHDHVLPDWYQTMFLSRERATAVLSQFFDDVLFVPRGLCNYQDALIACKHPHARQDTVLWERTSKEVAELRAELQALRKASATTIQELESLKAGHDDLNDRMNTLLERIRNWLLPTLEKHSAALKHRRRLW
jgi:SAM-dependent methyltransferase